MHADFVSPPFNKNPVTPGTNTGVTFASSSRKNDGSFSANATTTNSHLYGHHFNSHQYYTRNTIKQQQTNNNKTENLKSSGWINM